MDCLKARQGWVESALADQRHARQLLEAAVSATYNETILRIRDVVRAAIPRGATVLVISKGDEELLKQDDRRAWHFPRSESGEYAGYYPADSGAAIEHLESLIANGGEYLLLPNSAFWWLEHYRGLEAHLDRMHLRVWRDDRCAIYKLYGPPGGASGSRGIRPLGIDQRAPALEERKAPSVSTSRFSVICFPIIDWDYRFQRPQQLMRQFASGGHEVFYLSHRFRKSGERITFRQLGDRLREVFLRGSQFMVRHGALDEDSRRALLKSLNALQSQSLPGPTVAIVQSAFWWPVVKEAAKAFRWPVVYDCMDYHAGFATSNPLLAQQERDLLVGADLVVASSAWLETEARKHNRNVLLLRNACDYDHFAKIPPKQVGDRPVIGYYGAIAEWFDSDLVADLAERRPDWDFILVGSTVGADLSRLSKLPNVSLPGEKPYSEIPDWLAKFDVAILPFKRTTLTEATNPVKAYEILASGKPLVSVPLPETRLMHPQVCIASAAEEFERAIENELAQADPNVASDRRAFARQNTWGRRFGELGSALAGLLNEPGSNTIHAAGICAIGGDRASEANAAGTPEPRKLAIAGILDEFTAACLRPDSNLITFRPDNWQDVLERTPPDLLFVESAWHGNGGSWQYKIASSKRPMGEQLVDLVAWCKKRGIPTVFWNKEDPAHFDRFIHRAGLFDHVFTSDADAVPRYREALQHDRVFALPFAAQPRIHNPILETLRAHNVCFAGAYYNFDHDERRANLDILLRPAMQFGLHIFDRQRGFVGSEAQAYQFPRIYHPAIQGRLEYEEMVRAYKRYKVFLNVNSVTGSPTMFSRRVFELLAAGTPVISSPAKAIPLVLGDDTVLISNSEQQTEAHLQMLLNDERFWAERSLRGIRAVLSRHTVGNRLKEVCRHAGVSFVPAELPHIKVVAKLRTANEARRLYETLARQTYRNFSVAIILEERVSKRTLESAVKNLPDTAIQILPPGSSLLQQLLETSHGCYVWLVNMDDSYGNEFLHDAVLATRYSNADVIGKQSHFELVRSELHLRNVGYDFRWAKTLSPGSVVARAGILDRDQWGEIAADRPAALPNLRAFSIDRFNYIRGGGLGRTNQRVFV